MDCEQTLDLLPGYAVGALSDDSAQLEVHLGTCQTCRQELDDLTAAASLLAETVPASTVRPEVKLELFERIDSEQRSPSRSNELGLSGKAFVAKQNWRTYGPYIAAMFCAAAVGYWVAHASDSPSFNGSSHVWQQRIAAAEQAFGSPRIQLVRLGADVSGQGLAVALFRDGLSGEYHVLVANSAPPSPGQQLWLWVFDRQNVRLLQGPLEYLGQGHAAAIIKLRAPSEVVSEGVAKVIVTAEPPGDHAAPTGPVVGRTSRSDVSQ